MFEDRLVQAFNSLSATSPQLFASALWLSDRVTWVLCALALVALWFSGRDGAPLTRNESRQRTVVIAVGMLAAFLVAHLLSNLFPRPAPLTVLPLQAPIDVQVWRPIVAAFADSHSFPSDHAALWFGLVAALFFFNWRAGALAALISLVFAAVRVSVGFNYPLDIIAGACIGVLSMVALFAIRGRLTWLAGPITLLFEGLPAVAYPFGLLFLFDMCQGFNWIFHAATVIFGIQVRR
jgi:undecaprenyl-diphosphatase